MIFAMKHTVHGNLKNFLLLDAQIFFAKTFAFNYVVDDLYETKLNKLKNSVKFKVKKQSGNIPSRCFCFYV